MHLAWQSYFLIPSKLSHTSRNRTGRQPPYIYQKKWWVSGDCIEFFTFRKWWQFVVTKWLPTPSGFAHSKPLLIVRGLHRSATSCSLTWTDCTLRDVEGLQIITIWLINADRLQARCLKSESLSMSTTWRDLIWLAASWLYSGFIPVEQLQNADVIVGFLSM